MIGIKFNLFLNTCVNNVCYTGNIVTGIVTTTFTSKQKIEDLSFRVIGLCKASWTRPMPTTPYIKFYSHDDIFLDIELDIFDKYIGKVIEPGIETHNFYFSLPEGLPSSFQGSLGKVTYYMLIESRTSCRFRRKKYFPFTVYNKLNINHLEEYVTPSYFNISSNFKYSGTLSMSIKTFTGFAGLQNIPIEISICNDERINISDVSVTLIQKVRYNASSGYADEEKKICKIEHKILSNTVKDLCTLKMHVPDIIPSSINLRGQVFEVNYILRVSTSFPYHFTHYEDIPVTVASVPVIHYDDSEEVLEINK